MDIRGLRYFIKLAECLNFTHAAKSFFITQTAMSQSIARMEEELGFKLFERNNRNVELTPAGRYFYGQMYTLVEDYDAAVQHALNLAEGRDGTIRIAVVSHLDGVVLMKWLRNFQKKYPEIELQLETIEPRMLETYIKEQKVDIGMCWTGAWKWEDPDLEMVDLAGYPVCAMVRRDSMLARMGRTSVSQGELRSEEHFFVELRGSLIKNKSITEMIIPGGVDARHLVRKNSMADLLLEVEVHNRIALLPGFMRNYIPREAAVKMLEITGEDLKAVYVSMIYLKKHVRPPLEKLLDTLQELGNLE